MKTSLMTPVRVAHAIFEQARHQTGGDTEKASIVVLHFLTEALVYSAIVSTGDLEVNLKDLLETIGKQIVEHSLVPIFAFDLEAWQFAVAEYYKQHPEEDPKVS